jgi:hypothetical protein
VEAEERTAVAVEEEAVEAVEAVEKEEVVAEAEEARLEC